MGEYKKMEVKPLDWQSLGSPANGSLGAMLKNPDGSTGVTFYASYRPTCHRRGPWLLQIDVLGGQYHHCWGCFDEADQPIRNYHCIESVMPEAEAIAEVLQREFDIDQFHKDAKPDKSFQDRKDLKRLTDIIRGLTLTRAEVAELIPILQECSATDPTPETVVAGE